MPADMPLTVPRDTAPLRQKRVNISEMSSNAQNCPFDILFMILLHCKAAVLELFYAHAHKRIAHAAASER